jgi:hypothetical protein
LGDLRAKWAIFAVTHTRTLDRRGASGRLSDQERRLSKTLVGTANQSEAAATSARHNGTLRALRERFHETRDVALGHGAQGYA